MRLIRLKSKPSDLTGHFSNRFQTPIKIEPFSQVALISAIVAMDARLIQVNTTNNTFSFKRKAGETDINVVIPAKNYSIGVFLKALKEQMNKAMPYDDSVGGTLRLVGNRAGFLWAPSVNQGTVKYLKLNFAKASIIDVGFPTGNVKGTIAITDTKTITGPTSAAGVATFDNLVSTNQTFNPGVGEVTARVTNNGECIVGLIKPGAEDGGGEYDASIYAYGINYDTVTTSYSIIINGSAVVATPTPANADIIRIKLDNGKIKFSAIAGGTETALGDAVGYEYDFSADYRVACSMTTNTNGAGAMVIDSFQYHENLENKSLPGPDNDIVRQDFTAPEVVHSNLGAVPASRVSLSLPDGARELLGFEKDADLAKVLLSGSFNASNDITNTSTPLSLNVELPNLGRMENHDGLDGSRRQIVASMPRLTTTGSDLVYEAKFPLFININNQYPISLSEIECRILTSLDNKEIEIEDPGVSLLFAIHKSPQSSTNDSTK